MSDAPEQVQPAPDYRTALAKAAELWGIQPEYWDIFGQRHFTPAEVQQTILRSLAVPCETLAQLNRAIEDRLWSEWSELTPKTLVLSAASGYLPVHIAAEEEESQIVAEFRWEHGGGATVQCDAKGLALSVITNLRGREFRRKKCPLPPNAPLGYHELSIRLEGSGRSATTRLILCPDRAYVPPGLEGNKLASGIAVSLYGLRSARNWGCGDFTDLENLIDWVADEGLGSFIGLNPLHALANRVPYNTSPYLPICTFYRNPIYLDVERVPDAQASPVCGRLLGSSGLQGRAAELRASQYVDYESVWRLKQKFLKAAFRHFLTHEYRPERARGKAFREFVEREGELLDHYAVYSALDEVLHKRNRDVWIWHDWPGEYHDPASQATREFAARHWRLVLFYKYMQWLVEEQIGAAQEHALTRGLTVGLYHDLALATDRYGSDLWAHREFYVAGCRVGAPPDDFSPEGQDWAFPPPNSVRHHQDGYRLFAESIRKNARDGGALRIDHVMRFFRLFWIPDGVTAKGGAYVLDYHEDLLHILALESVRNRFMVVGEDLGTVEPWIREELQRFGVLSYRLLYFEKTGDGRFKRPAEYPTQALVSATTHDLPTLAGFWTGADIEARQKAGLLPDPDSHRRQLASRQQEKQNLLDLLHQLTLLPPHVPRNAAQIPELTGDLHYAAIGFLALSPSMLMLVNQEDLFKDPEQQNLPGSTAQYPNWRHKMRFTLEELRTNPFARDCTAMLRGWIESSGRGR